MEKSLVINQELKDEILKLINYSMEEVQSQTQLQLEDIQVADRPTLGDHVSLSLFRFVRIHVLREVLGSRLSSAILYQSGKQIARKMQFQQVEDILVTLTSFLTGHLAIICQDEESIIIEEDECATCAGIPPVGEPICHFEAGFIAGGLEQVLGTPLEVRETKCWGTGDRVCRFEVTFLKEKKSIEDVSVAEMIATLTGKAASAMDLAAKLKVQNELLESELRMAGQVQRVLLPGAPPKVDGVEFSVKYLPSLQIGGDFYDFYISDDKVGVFIADVSGHGVRSALITGVLKNSFIRCASLCSRPNDLMQMMNTELINLIQDTEMGIFVTAFYGVIDLKRKTISYSNAGHPFPYLLLNEETRLEPLESSDIALGIDSDAKYQINEKKLRKGDKLLIFTDGLFEARNIHGELFGEKRVEEYLINSKDLDSQELLSGLWKKLESFSADVKADDDINIITVGITK